MRAAADLKRALAHESLQALAKLRSTGEPPTAETAPTLMAVWQSARDKLLKGGAMKSPETFTFEGLKCLFGVLWGAHGQLERFYLRDRYTGYVLLSGDTNGPAFFASRTPAKNTAESAPSNGTTKENP